MDHLLLRFVLAASLCLLVVSGCSSDVETDSETQIDAEADSEDSDDAGDAGPYERECQPDDFVYHDRGCDLPSRDTGTGDEATCSEEGDGKCYARCETDADCTDPERPHCSNLGLYSDSDYSCAEDINICHAEEFDDCEW